MTALTVLSTEIRLHDGLYSLNDLHRAAGKEDRHRPSLWLENQQSKDLINELKEEAKQRRNSAFGDEQSRNFCFAPVKSIRGGPGGSATYACRELVYAYAMWISPRFHLRVIRAFDAMAGERTEASGQPEAALSCRPVTTPAIRRAIDRRAHALCMDHYERIREQIYDLVERFGMDRSERQQIDYIRRIGHNHGQVMCIHSKAELAAIVEHAISARAAMESVVHSVVDLKRRAAA